MEKRNVYMKTISVIHVDGWRHPLIWDGAKVHEVVDGPEGIPTDKTVREAVSEILTDNQERCMKKLKEEQQRLGDTIWTPPSQVPGKEEP